ncbi:hypothetical protein GCM10027075_04830 [Streptomyces heilongjiangensis]
MGTGTPRAAGPSGNAKTPEKRVRTPPGRVRTPRRRGRCAVGGGTGRLRGFMDDGIGESGGVGGGWAVRVVGWSGSRVGGARDGVWTGGSGRAAGAGRRLRGKGSVHFIAPQGVARSLPVRVRVPGRAGRCRRDLGRVSGGG